MNALRQNFEIDTQVAPTSGLAHELAAELALELPLARDLTPRWEEVHAMARDIARLGQLAAEKPRAEIADFPHNALAAPDWRCALADSALGDLSAILQPGLAALRAIEAEGRDPTAAAVTLWREFHHARQGILGLVLPETASPA